MVYYYTKITIPDLDLLEINILESIISDTYQYFVWDEDDNKLKVFLNRELTYSEKLILDNIIG